MKGQRMKRKLEKLVCVSVEKHFTIKLLASDIIDSLRARKFDVPTNAVVSVIVPSGGDYSGESLCVAGETPLYVTWTEKSVEDRRE